MAFHCELTGLDIHVINTWTYANSAAREAATGFVSDDVYKVSVQTDDDSIWILVDHSPITWQQLGGVVVGEIDHCDLDNLLEDCHTQYMPTDASRAFSQPVCGAPPTIGAHLTTKAYVDGEIVTDHGALNGLLDVEDHPGFSTIDGTRAFTAPVSGVDPILDNHLATKSYVDTEVAAVSAGGGAFEDLPIVQVIRSSNLSINTGDWQDIPFDITDVENNPSIIEHDDVNTDRIKIKEMGTYVVQYNCSLDLAGEAGDDDFFLRVIKNDSMEVSGSRLQLNDSGDMHTHSGTAIVECTGGSDYVTLQISNNVTTATLMTGASFKVARLRGTKGDAGPAGSGSSIHVYEDGVLVTGSPFEILNFTGNVSTSASALSGGVDIDIPAPSGNGGGGTFGSEFQQVSSEGESSTTSDTYQQKLRLTTGSLPSGVYRIGWYAEIDGQTDPMDMQVELNDTTQIGFNDYDSSLSDYINCSGFYYDTLSGVNTIDIDWREGGGEGLIRRARLEIWRVS